MTQELTKIDFSDNAKVVLEKRFLSEGETPEQRMWDMCVYVASAEKNYSFNKTGSFLTQIEQKAKNVVTWADKFYYELILPKKFFPNSPTIVNAGSKALKGGLQACNVISPQDTMESIYQTVKDWAMTEKFGAGIGAYFGDIRAKGSPIGTTHGKALGPVAVMKILSESSKWITQGSFREGAHMAILPIDHADIFEFIHCKDDCKQPGEILHNFNISIQMPDWFMEQVVGPNIDQEDDAFNSKKLWNEICKSAWKTGDPGLFFIDRIRETEPNPQLGLIQAPNPCGEQPLENYNSCNLGSINLGKFVLPKSHHIFDIDGLDWDSLRETIHLAVRFLDDVIDVNIFPDEVPQLSEMNQKTRRIGLGVMGWHDMLVMLNIPYESDEAIILADNLSRFLTEEAWKASVELGNEKGEFPEYYESMLAHVLEFSKVKWDKKKSGPRNSCVTTVAPTGTLNILADCSSGIEPYYSLYTERKALWSQGESQSTITEVPRTLVDFLMSEFPNNKELDLSNGEYIKEWVRLNDAKGLFKTALEISPEWHIKHQAAWQKNITNGISKTINLPNNADVEDISQAYMAAWKAKCKGATVYRDGCKDVQVLTTNSHSTITGGGQVYESGLNGTDKKIHPVERPKVTTGDTTKINTGHGKAYITVNSIAGTPIEVFCTSGKAGKCDSATTEAITRLVSLCLRSKVDPMEVVEQLRNITCCPIWDDSFQIMSLPDAVSKVLFDHINQPPALSKENLYHAVENLKRQDAINNRIDLYNLNHCIECGGKIEYNEGCLKCSSCGWTKC